MEEQPEVTCEFGYYPYCPLCEHGAEIVEEWMPEGMCEWFCKLKAKQQHAQKTSYQCTE